MIWFNGSTSTLTIYETINGTLNTRETASVSISAGVWYAYKVTYNPSTGTIQVWKNNEKLAQWTDSTPISSGTGISLRTNATDVEFDDLKVYKYRDTKAKVITAGSGTTNDIRTQTGKVKSIVRDGNGNWSNLGDANVTLDF